MGLTTLIGIEEMLALRHIWDEQNLSVAFVPTMGDLHEGHLSLVEQAKSMADKTVVSIFVNPAQFGPKEDFARYPRPLSEDIKKLDSLNIDVAFVPNAAEIYPESFQTYVTNKKMSFGLCGASRTGHFEGVLTVVLKLFNIVRPAVAVFGKKDYQQLRCIQRMVDDFCLNLSIIETETVRDEHGLALSSRNKFLRTEDRSKAAQIFQALTLAKQSYQNGETNPENLLEIFRTHLASYPEINIEYADIRLCDSLEKVNKNIEKSSVLLIAAKISGVRLIDNIELG